MADVRRVGISIAGKMSLCLVLFALSLANAQNFDPNVANAALKAANAVGGAGNMRKRIRDVGGFLNDQQQQMNGGNNNPVVADNNVMNNNPNVLAPNVNLAGDIKLDHANDFPKAMAQGNMNNPNGQQILRQQGFPQQPQPQPVRKSPTVKLSEHPECRDDVKTYCASSTNNFAILDCLQNDLKSDQDISPSCQNVIWEYKKNLTTDARFESAAKEVCKEELHKFKECEALRGDGNLIPCLLELKENITAPNCRTFLTKMASIIFGDYRMISNLVNACQQNIQDFKCGRLHQENDHSPHSQGRTIECLSEHIKELQSQCKHEILRIAELQADDYHLDRPLFYACREDRDRLCPRTKAGSGKIYKCLTRHKFDREMSSDCREKLTSRQKLMQSDYKVNKGLAQSCQRDIIKNRCIDNEDPGFKHARLSKVVLCLENVMKKGIAVEEDCILELKDVRKSLMEDYQISPEIVSACAEDIRSHCNGGIERQGKTLHCLMDLARPRADNTMIVVQLKPVCMREIEELLHEADVGEDWTLDPYLHDACNSVVQAHCKEVKEGEGRVLSCLMEHLDSADMSSQCEARLMEIHYFLARDFRLDSRLFRSCRDDAAQLCGADDEWHQSKNTPNVEKGPLTFACLYRRLKLGNKEDDKKLTRACAFEVRRVMRQRAISVELEPRIEEPCMEDLGAYCSDDLGTKQEMDCLQRNFEELSERCQWAVGNFTEDEEDDPNMDRILMKSCSPMIKQFCEAELENDAEPGDVMECLIKHKNDPSMNEKCAVGIQHHQLISMKTYTFSTKFKDACKKDVLENCRSVHKKSQVIECLSEKVRDAVLKDESHVISKRCRKQLSFELLQQSENINLDPELKDDCENDIKMLCSNVSPGHSAIIECLKKNEKTLSETCRERIFKREKNAAIDMTGDYLLMQSCKRMIKRFCMNEEPSQMFQCLVEKKSEDDFDYKCKKVLIERMRQKNTDVHLNPALFKGCKKDILQHCSQVVHSAKANVAAQGEIIQCLKIKFSQRILSESCQVQVRSLIKEVAEDYKQDPKLVAACGSEIDRLCSESKAADAQDPDGGRVIECLKQAVNTGKLDIKQNMKCVTEVARILAEDRADIHVDPLLYRECSLDIKHYCFDVPRGEGRQMSCMLAALSDKKVTLRPTCKKMLEDRVKMWEMAAQVAPPNTLQELILQVTTSESRNYFLGVIFAIIGMIFIGGLMCGRVTKRVRAELKDR